MRSTTPISSAVLPRIDFQLFLTLSYLSKVCHLARAERFHSPFLAAPFPVVCLPFGPGRGDCGREIVPILIDGIEEANVPERARPSGGETETWGRWSFVGSMWVRHRTRSGAPGLCFEAFSRPVEQSFRRFHGPFSSSYRRLPSRLPSATIAVTVGYHFLVTDLEDTTRIGMRLLGSRYRRLPQLPLFGCTPRKDWTPPGEAQRPGLAEGSHLFCRWGMLMVVVTTVTGVDSSELPVYMRVIRPVIRLPSFGNLR